MVTETLAENGTGKPGAGSCPTIESQLNDISQKIIEFDAQKLPELKAELEAVKKKKDDAIKDYAAKFEGLKKVWCEQNDHILSIRRDLIGAFPEWRKHIEECVCPKLAERRKQEQRIACRSEVKGRFEKAREEARVALEVAKAAATGWENAVKVITDQLTANGKLIEELCKLTCSPDRVVAIPKLWCKLLSAHARIRPITDCFDVPVSEMCEQLCPPGECDEAGRNCDKYEPAPPASGDCAPKPPAGEDDKQQTPPAEPSWPRSEPWLCRPEEYAGKIDCAYDGYLKTKQAFGIAVRCYQTYPDDLAQVRKDLDALAKGFDTAVEECLKQTKGKGCCEKEEGKDNTPNPCNGNGARAVKS
jgi:hypothetical protein